MDGGIIYHIISACRKRGLIFMYFIMYLIVVEVEEIFRYCATRVLERVDARVFK